MCMPLKAVQFKNQNQTFVNCMQHYHRGKEDICCLMALSDTPETQDSYAHHNITAPKGFYR